MLLGLGVFAIKSSLILLIAAFGCWALRNEGASLRHRIWTTAFCVILILPALGLIVPHRSLKIMTPAIPAGATPSSDLTRTQPVPGPQLSPSQTAPEVELIRTVKPTSPVKLTQDRPDIAKWAMMIWLVGALICLAYQLGSVCLLAIFARRHKLADTGSYHATALKAGVSRAWRLVIGQVSGTAGPMTWGILKPTVAMPEASLNWSPDQFDTVLIHELTHVRRLDCLTQSIGLTACALLWFNPAMWLSLRAQRAEAEAATDDAVLESGIMPSTYAAALLHVAREAPRRRPYSLSAGVPLMKTPTIDARIRTILSSNHRLCRMTRWSGVLILAASLLVTAPCAVLQIETAPTTSNSPQTQAATATALAAQNAIRDKVEAEFQAQRKLESEDQAHRHHKGIPRWKYRKLTRAQAGLAKAEAKIARLIKKLYRQRAALSMQSDLLATQHKLAEEKLLQILRTNDQSKRLNKLSDEIKAKQSQNLTPNEESRILERQKAIEDMKRERSSTEGELKPVKDADKQLSRQYQLYKVGTLDRAALEYAQAAVKSRTPVASLRAVMSPTPMASFHLGISPAPMVSFRLGISSAPTVSFRLGISPAPAVRSFRLGISPTPTVSFRLGISPMPVTSFHAVLSPTPVVSPHTVKRPHGRG